MRSSIASYVAAIGVAGSLLAVPAGVATAQSNQPAAQPQAPAATASDISDRQIDAVAADLKVGQARMALAWLMARPGITAPIASATTPAQLDELVGALRLELGPDAIGELWIRGPGILKGYWNKPEATAEAFREGGWFRTGDLFRRDAQGFHYIVGRVKDMIRRSGENIAAREVEAVLLQLDAVAEVAVIPVPDADRSQEVKACLVLKPGLTPADLPPEAVFAHFHGRTYSGPNLGPCIEALRAALAEHDRLRGRS